MLPPKLVRRLVLAPMAIVLAVALIVLSPLLLVLALLFGVAGLARAGQMRNLRLVSFAVLWLTAEIVTVFILLGLWIVSGVRRADADRAVSDAALRGGAVVPFAARTLMGRKST